MSATLDGNGKGSRGNRVGLFGLVSRNVAKRELNAAARDIIRTVGKHWKDKMLPKHFQERAKSEYGYKERSAKYIEQKARGYIIRGENPNGTKKAGYGQHMSGHRNPLVYSGDSRRRALGPTNITATATSTKGARVTVPINANTLNLHDAGKGAHDLYAEAVIVSPAEVKTLEKLFQEGVRQASRDFKVGGSRRARGRW
jgi:hypothetical protein